MKYAFVLVASFFFGTSAWALLPSPKFTKSGIGLTTASGTDSYRMGDEWGQSPVTAEILGRSPPAFRRAALATARVGGGTGFYLGKFNGRHVMATNHHVFPTNTCNMRTVRFPFLGLNLACETFLGSWTDVDLTLFTVRVNPADEAKLLAVAGNFRLHEDVASGEKLMTIGFGVAGNSGGQLMANQDSDCYVFSPTGEYRFMADPDQYNPGEYRAWSFALGCDVSHGDSGSAIVDRETSAVVGIIWTGRIPKSSEVQSSAYLNRMYQENAPGIWDQLSYAVPAKKIGEHLQRLTEGNLGEPARGIFLDMLR